MIVLLLAYRALEYRTRRQDLQLVLLALFVVVMTGVLTMELSFAVQIVLFTPVAMFVLFLVNLSETADRGEEEIPPKVWQGFRWRTFLTRLRRVLDHRLLAFSGALFIGMAVSAGLLFVALPRFELGQALPFLRMQAQQSLSGFSETVEFGEVVDIIQNNSVALRVDVSGARPAEVPYWRLLALDQYTGSGFRLSDSARNADRSLSDYRFGPLGGSGRSQETAVWTVYLEGGISRYLPVPGKFEEMRFQAESGFSSLVAGPRPAGGSCQCALLPDERPRADSGAPRGAGGARAGRGSAGPHRRGECHQLSHDHPRGAG